MKRKVLMKIVMTLLVIFVITVSPVLAMTYSYDDLGRLTSVTFDSGQSTTYSYDSAGNMLSITNNLGDRLITAYSLAAQTGPDTIDSSKQTVTVTVNNGTDVTKLIAAFTLSDGSSNAQVGSTAQVSGTTANDFTKSVIYRVIAADGSELDWTVTVTLANNTNLVTAYSLAAQTGPAVIDSTNHTVAMTVKSGTDVTNLVATFTLPVGASAQVGSTAQVSGTTSNNFTNPVIYKVTGADGSEQDWTVTVTVGVHAAPISETLTVSNPSTAGFTVALSPALTGLSSDFTLMDGSTPVTIGSATDNGNGTSYTIAATLTAGKTYTITATDTGYTFGTAQNVAVPSEPATTTYAVSGVISNANGPLVGATVFAGSGNSTTTGTDGTYTLNLSTGDFTLTVSKTGYQTGTISGTVKGTAVSNENLILTATAAPTLSGIAITTPATKLSYTVGDALDLTGLVVTGTNSDNSTNHEAITATNVTGFDSSVAAANQTLTITIGGKTTNYMITIQAAQSFVVGDVDGNGVFDLTDYGYMKLYLLGKISSFPASYGMQSGKVCSDGTSTPDLVDYGYMKLMLLGKISKFPIQ